MNHTLNISNGGTNTISCVARQFTRVRLVPSGATTGTEYAFVANPNTTINVPVHLDQAGVFELRLFTAQGTSIWWGSVALAVGGTTEIRVSTINTGFAPNSYAAGMPSSGNDIPCS